MEPSKSLCEGPKARSLVSSTGESRLFRIFTPVADASAKNKFPRAVGKLDIAFICREEVGPVPAAIRSVKAPPQRR